MIFPCMDFFVIFQVFHDFQSLWEPCRFYKDFYIEGSFIIYLSSIHVCMFVWADAFSPSQQFFSHVRTFPWLNQYKSEDKVSSSRTQHSASSEVKTSDPSITSRALYRWATTLLLANMSQWWDFKQCDICDQQSLRSACSYGSLMRAFAYGLNILWLLSYWLNTIWSF